MFQHFDRVNDVLGGRLVIVQGSFNAGTTASAGTHDRAGALDVRTWNLTIAERDLAMRTGRDPGRVGGAAWWYRHLAQGFDPHIHLVLLGDGPMTPQTKFQETEYKAGRTGLANRARDDFWRPSVIRNYQFIEDDMYTDADRRAAQNHYEAFQTFRKNSLTRDQAERDRDNERYSNLITALGKHADLLTTVINNTKDDATKTQLTRAKNEILLALKEDPDVTGVDNPSDDAVRDL
jgi:hypothetical protein